MNKKTLSSILLLIFGILAAFGGALINRYAVSAGNHPGIGGAYDALAAFSGFFGAIIFLVGMTISLFAFLRVIGKVDIKFD